jgi:hypothetical protein
MPSSAYNSDESFDELMDDMQVLYAMRAGHVVSQDDIDALNRLDAHYRSEEERATDAYHRGWTDGLRKSGGERLVEAEELASERWAEASAQKVMRGFAEQRADELQGLLRELHATVVGECSWLLDEDSGGSVALALQIEAALAKAGGAA